LFIYGSGDPKPIALFKNFYLSGSVKAPPGPIRRFNTIRASSNLVNVAKESLLSASIFSIAFFLSSAVAFCFSDSSFVIFNSYSS